MNQGTHMSEAMPELQAQSAPVQKKFTIEDVRNALWEAYREASRGPDYCCKSSEAWCEVHYPPYYGGIPREEFDTPTELKVYSYALGPSRQHSFILSHRESQPNYYTWKSPDPFATAVRVIGEWMTEFRANRDEQEGK